MSYRNRYCIGGSNGMIQLSIPLVHGRNQRTLMKDVKISNDTNWQIQHWRTLVSVYKRSPYFEFYEYTLQPLFERKFDFLIDFSKAGIQWLKEQAGILFKEDETQHFIKSYTDANDLREQMKPGAEKKENSNNTQYYQVFADRTGFTPNLSLLDLLFSEGPHTKDWIKANRDGILQHCKSK